MKRYLKKETGSILEIKEDDETFRWIKTDFGVGEWINFSINIEDFLNKTAKGQYIKLSFKIYSNACS